MWTVFNRILKKVKETWHQERTKFTITESETLLDAVSHIYLEVIAQKLKQSLISKHGNLGANTTLVKAAFTLCFFLLLVVIDEQKVSV